MDTQQIVSEMTPFSQSTALVLTTTHNIQEKIHKNALDELTRTEQKHNESSYENAKQPKT